MSETISVHNMFSPGLSLEFSCIALVICIVGYLDDAKIRASNKDLPVPTMRSFTPNQGHHSKFEPGKDQFF